MIFPEYLQKHVVNIRFTLGTFQRRICAQ